MEVIIINGSIRERIIKTGKNRRGKLVKNLKVYDVYFRFKCPQTGKNKQTSKKGFRTKGEAELYLLEINSQIVGNNYIPPQKLSVREYFVEWLDTYVENQLRQSTIYGYRINLEKHVIPHLGNIELKNLNSTHIDNLYALKQKEGRLDGKGGLSPKSILYIHRVLSEALEHAVKKKLISNNPAKNVTNLPRTRKFKSTILETKEIKDLLQAVKDTDMELPIALASIVGLRRGELLGLKMEDISLENNSVHIRRQLIPTKNGPALVETKSEDSNRIINIPLEVLDILKRHLIRKEERKLLLGDEYFENEIIICNPDGRLIDPRNFSHRFARCLKANGFTHTRLHDLRHFCATLMLRASVPMKVASQILGHSSIGITADLYSHVLDDMKKDAALKVGQEIFGKSDIQ